jgi:hypothetical protein
VALIGAADGKSLDGHEELPYADAPRIAGLKIAPPFRRNWCFPRKSAGIPKNMALDDFALGHVWCFMIEK